MADPESLFIVYLIAVRLGTIAAGVWVIRYACRLFSTGVFKTDTSGATTEMSGRVGEYELKFKTAAPGSVLGLFGAVIIVMAIASAPPELAEKNKVIHETPGIAGTTTIETTRTMRGENTEISQVLEEAAKHKQKGEKSEAIRSYQQAFRMIVKPMNELARLYREVNRLEHAKALVEVAIIMNPSDPDCAITLEEIKGSMEKK